MIPHVNINISTSTMSATEDCENTNNNIGNSSGETEPFDIQLVYDSFSKCCEDTKALNMNHYLIGFKELYR